VTTLGWVLLAGAAVFLSALGRALMMINRRFPLDPELHSTPYGPIEHVDTQWPRQAQLSAQVDRSRKSRRAWRAMGPDLLRPMSSHLQRPADAAWAELSPPRRYDDVWMDATLHAAESELGLDPSPHRGKR